MTSQPTSSTHRLSATTTVAIATVNSWMNVVYAR